MKKKMIIILVSLCVQILFLMLLSMKTKQNRSGDYFSSHAIANQNILSSGGTITNGDYITFYRPVAENILAGRGIVTDDGRVAVRWVPGYPIILACIFRVADFFGLNRHLLILLFNIGIASLSTIVIYLISEILFNSRIAFVSSLIWITYPFNLWLIKQPNTEIPFLLCIFTGIWILFFSIKKKRFNLLPLIGPAIGLASLIRPGSIFSIILFALFVYLCKDIPANRFLISISMILLFLITILPWEYYVYQTNGEIIPLSAGAPPSIIDGLTFAGRKGVGGDQLKSSKDVVELSKKIEANRSNLETTSKIIRFFQHELSINPKPVIKLFIMKIFRSWYGTDQLWYEHYILLIQIIYFIPCLAGIVMALKTFKEQLRNFLFLFLMILYFWMMTITVSSILRFMIPAMAVMLIFSALPMVKAYDKIKWMVDGRKK